MKLSPEMQRALDAAKAQDGRLYRCPGGFWHALDAKLNPKGVPDLWFGKGTVDALVKRGAMEYSEWKTSTISQFAVVARVKEVA